VARFTVIGLGKFGSEVVQTLYQRGHEVVGIDSDREAVQELRDSCSRAIQADCTDQDTLQALDIADSDAVVVSLGERMDASILVTLYLKELGLRQIVAKAVSEDHGKILRLIGATHVVHPERDTARRLAVSIGSRTVIDYLPLAEGVSIIELSAPPALVGRSLAELGLRREYNVLVVAARVKERMLPAPGPEYRVGEGDVLFVLGKDADVATLMKALT